MGYYGLGPGMRVADVRTPEQEALRALPQECWQLTLDTLEKVFKNIVQNPKEEKFRKIKLSNAKITQAITSVDGALEYMFLSGWVYSNSEATATESAESAPMPMLTLPLDIKFTMPSHVNKIIDAREYYKKEEERKRIDRGLSRNIPTGTVFPDIRADGEADKMGKVNLDLLGKVGNQFHRGIDKRMAFAGGVPN